jgi:hypothetical protein
LIFRSVCDAYELAIKASIARQDIALRQYPHLTAIATDGSFISRQILFEEKAHLPSPFTSFFYNIAKNVTTVSAITSPESTADVGSKIQTRIPQSRPPIPDATSVKPAPPRVADD